MGIIIKGTGSYVPEKILTNADLEKMVETSDEWIRTRTGIQERHIASAEQATSDLAVAAAKKALEKAGLAAEDLDLIVVATVTPDHSFPSTACMVQKQIGAGKALCFDLVAACSGLLYSMETAFSLLKSRDKYKNALVIGAEKLSSITNWTDRNTCVLFGDGAGAVVMGKDDAVDYDCIVASDLHADGNYSEVLKRRSGGSRMPDTAETIAEGLNCIYMEGKEVFKLAVGAMVGSAKSVLAQSGVGANELRYVIPHQANCRIIDAVAQRLEVENEVVYRNVHRYGNTSAASIGLCLDEINSAGAIERGEYLLLTSFGGGLTWAALLIKW